MNLADYLNTYSNNSGVDWGSLGPTLQKLGIGQNGRDGSAGWQFNNNMDAGDVGWSLSPEAAAKLQGYTVGNASRQGDTRTQQIMGPDGQAVGGSTEDMSRNLMDTLGPLLAGGIAMAGGVPIMGAAFGGGALGGAAAGGLLGGATAAAQGNNVGQGLLMGGIGGGISGAMGGVPAGGAQGAAQGAGAITSDYQGAIDAYLQSNPVQMQDLMQGIPDIGSITDGGALAQGAAQSAQFRPSVDSQAYNQSAGITGQQAANAATVPSSVNLANAGGTMSTGGDLLGSQTTGVDPMRQQEISGYQTDGRMPTSPAVPAEGAGLLGGLKDAGSGALDWMKANPGLAKLLMGGAGALLSSQGPTGGAAPKAYGAPVKWNSALPGLSQGLLSGQMGGQSGGQASGYPAAMGLLGGQQNSGAWRFLGK